MPGLQRVLCKSTVRVLCSRDSLYSEYTSGFQYNKILKVSRVLVCNSFTGYIDRIFDVLRLLNMPEFSTYYTSSE